MKYSASAGLRFVALLLPLMGCHQTSRSQAASAPAESKVVAPEPAISMPLDTPVPAVSSTPGVTLAAPPPGATSLPADIATIALPEREIPAHRAPIAVDLTRIDRPVKAGDTIGTSCFTVVAEAAGVAQGVGCRLALATLSLGPGTTPDVPYFEAECFSGGATKADGMLQEVLSSIAAANAARPPGALRDAALARGIYSDDFGPFLGAQSGFMFGSEARIAAWGGARGSHQLDIVAPLPHDAYLWSGKPVVSLLVRGYTGGYHSRAFAASLASLHMR